MPRPQRPPRERRSAPVNDAIWLWLLDGDRPADDFELFMLDMQGDQNSQLRALWADIGATVVDTFANLYPGKRPRVWWRLEAPEMRRRVGGHGLTESSLLACVPAFDRGIPSGWLLDDWIWTRDGEKPPAGYVAFDRTDPPTFESEATYLRRLNLLLPGEARRLRTADFEPESVEIFDTPNDPGPIHDETCSTGRISPETD